MLDIGTISSRTLRTASLLWALGEALEREAKAAKAKDDAEIRLAREALALSERIDREESEGDYSETAELDTTADVITELYDYLQGFAPPYCYVGALEGDGAEIGVWIDWEQIAMDEHDRELIRIDAGDDRPEPVADGPGAILEVTDHGNATLYVRTPNADYEPARDEWREAWAVV